MGVNMVGNCIVDDDFVSEASRMEIIRRYYTALCGQKEALVSKDVVLKLELLMQKAGITTDKRRVIAAANEKAEKTAAPAAAIELPDGRIITGKTSPLLGSSASLLLNSLKALAGIDDSIHLIAPEVIEPIQHLKVDHLGNHNPRLHTDEILIALSICATSSPVAELAMQQLEKLRGCEAHSSVILAQIDEKTFKKLGVNITCEPKYQTKKLYHSHS
jgi:uncharacterized protein (UPF0371 family)